MGRILLDGLTACAPFSMIVWLSFLVVPRIWLHAFPADIRRMAPPKTWGERRLTVIVGTGVLLCFFGLPILLTWKWFGETPGGFSFRDTLIHLYGCWMVVNLWDLLLIDWPYAYLVDPRRPPIPGTAGARGTRTTRFTGGRF